MIQNIFHFQVFHICWPISEVETAHWSFFCGNGTIFDQANLVCNFPEAAFPCSQAESIYGDTEFGLVEDTDYNDNNQDYYFV